MIGKSWPVTRSSTSGSRCPWARANSSTSNSGADLPRAAFARYFAIVDHGSSPAPFSPVSWRRCIQMKASSLLGETTHRISDGSWPGSSLCSRLKALCHVVSAARSGWVASLIAATLRLPSITTNRVLSSGTGATRTISRGLKPFSIMSCARWTSLFFCSAIRACIASLWSSCFPVR